MDEKNCKVIREEVCKNCEYAKARGYRQIECEKTGDWQVERYTCNYFKPKKDARK